MRNLPDDKMNEKTYFFFTIFVLVVSSIFVAAQKVDMESDDRIINNDLFYTKVYYDKSTSEEIISREIIYSVDISHSPPEEQE